MKKHKIVLFNKPYGVLTQFTDSSGRETLANYISIPHIYPAGRLDRDSEGLLVLTDDVKLREQITHPRYKMAKKYLAQIEGIPDEDSLVKLRKGILLNDGLTKPAVVRIIPEPELWPRNPPIRFRQTIPTTWLEITIKEGKNRQIRRMTAAIHHPTLRLVRIAIGEWTLEGLFPGEYKFVSL